MLEKVLRLQPAFCPWKQKPALFALTSKCGRRLLLCFVANWRKDGQHSTQPWLPSRRRLCCFALSLLTVTGGDRSSACDQKDDVLICRTRLHDHAQLHSRPHWRSLQWRCLPKCPPCGVYIGLSDFYLLSTPQVTWPSMKAAGAFLRPSSRHQNTGTVAHTSNYPSGTNLCSNQRAGSYINYRFQWELGHIKLYSLNYWSPN